jgi:hypothetical protein
MEIVLRVLPQKAALVDAIPQTTVDRFPSRYKVDVPLANIDTNYFNINSVPNYNVATANYVANFLEDRFQRGYHYPETRFNGKWQTDEEPPSIRTTPFGRRHICEGCGGVGVLTIVHDKTYHCL